MQEARRAGHSVEGTQTPLAPGLAPLPTHSACRHPYAVNQARMGTTLRATCGKCGKRVWRRAACDPWETDRE